jgi:LacI family transcriptional regulator
VLAVTIKDIAKKVGKSTTTVSRALHDHDDISPETKELVRKAAAELGYRPSILAQRLQKQRSDTIGFILPTFGPRYFDPFISEFLAGIGNTAARNGLDLLVSTHPPGESEMNAYREKVHSRLVDGLIIVRTRLKDPRIDFLLEENFPFVSFGRVENQQDFMLVDEDGELGMRLLVEHLLSLNHRRIAVIAPPTNLTFTLHRLKGIREKLNEAGLELDDDLVVHGDLTNRSGYEMASELLRRSQPPTAIVACNDLMAFGAMSAAQEQGFVIGRDISITGFDDIPMAEHSHPPLTTVHQPIYQIGARLCDMLINTIRGIPVKERVVLLRPELIIRQSCGAVP